MKTVSGHLRHKSAIPSCTFILQPSAFILKRKFYA